MSNESSRYIAMAIEGAVTVHARATVGGDYVTLCGLADDGEEASCCRLRGSTAPPVVDSGR
jgi:hypothetical protein